MRIIGAIAFGALIGLSGLVLSTQIVAAIFAYQPALGRPPIHIQATPFYWPWSIFTWSRVARDTYPRPFAIADFILLCSAAGAVIVVAVILHPNAPRVRRHGGDGWASFNDAREAGVLASSGAVLGKLDGEILAYDGPGHLLLVGASRSGKGRGHVVPTLLAWPHSALVLDVKGELASGDARHDFPGAAGFRETLGAVLRFAPTRADSARFNPLFEVRKGPNEVRDVQNVVNNQIRQIEQQAQMLARSPLQLSGELGQSLAQARALFDAARGVAFEAEEVGASLRELYPETFEAFELDAVLQRSDTWLEASRDSLELAMRAEAGAVASVRDARGRIDAALGASAGAEGQTGAAQAGNQLLGVTATQLAEIQTLLAAQGRALATERMERIAREQRASEIRRRAFPAARRTTQPARSAF